MINTATQATAQKSSSERRSGRFLMALRGARRAPSQAVELRFRENVAHGLTFCVSFHALSLCCCGFRRCPPSETKMGGNGAGG